LKLLRGQILCGRHKAERIDFGFNRGRSLSLQQTIAWGGPSRNTSEDQRTGSNGGECGLAHLVLSFVGANLTGLEYRADVARHSFGIVCIELADQCRGRMLRRRSCSIPRFLVLKPQVVTSSWFPSALRRRAADHPAHRRNCHFLRGRGFNYRQRYSGSRSRAVVLVRRSFHHRIGRFLGRLFHPVAPLCHTSRRVRSTRSAVSNRTRTMHSVLLLGAFARRAVIGGLTPLVAA